MALIPCYECGHEVSTQATTCPNCGAVLKEGFLEALGPLKRGSPVETNWGLRFTIAMLVGLVVYMVASYLKASQ